MKKILKVGLTDQTIDIFIQDSSSTTGAGLTGLAYNTASLVCYYRRGATGSATALTLATQTVGGAHSDGGFVEISSSNMPGMYRLDLSDTIVASGVSTVTLMLKGATNMAPLTIELQLVAVDLDDAVRFGLTSLPNAAADAAGGLIISDAGGLDADAQRADVAAILVDTGTTLDGRIPAALVGGRMDANMGAISADATAADNAESFFDGTGYAGTNNVIPTVTAVTTVNGLAANVITAASIASDAGVEIASAVWDRVLSAANHNIANSAGRRLRAIDSAFEVHSGTAASGAAGTITLDGAASATNDIYNGDRIVITAGTGIGEHGIILDYDGGTKVATMSKNWVITPDATSEFTIVPADCDIELWNGLAVTGDGDWAELQTDVDAILVDTATLPSGVKKNTALSNFEFVMIDSTDDVSGKTGVTVTAERSIDGGAFAACTNSASEVSAGVYKIDLSAADLNGDVITLKFTGTGCNATLLTVLTKP